MSRKLAKPQPTREEFARDAIMRYADTKKVIDEIRADQMEVDMHYYTGLMYTNIGLVLRSKPYYWPADKVMRFLNRLQGNVKDLEDGSIHISDLVGAAEKKGVRVLWNSSRKWITDICIFEEEKHD